MKSNSDIYPTVIQEINCCETKINYRIEKFGPDLKSKDFKVSFCLFSLSDWSINGFFCSSFSSQDFIIISDSTWIILSFRCCLPASSFCFCSKA